GAGDHGHRDDATPLARLDLRFGRLGLYQILRPLVVGVVHGLAGSAAVALLGLAGVPGPPPPSPPSPSLGPAPSRACWSSPSPSPCPSPSRHGASSFSIVRWPSRREC